MLLALLLQTTSVKTSDLNAVYIALGGTLTAALVAAVASFAASSRAAKTADKVVALSTQTTQHVAALSAQVSRESAALAARTAQELKDKDYKNEYYKRVIDKRMHALEEIEKVIGQFSTYHIVGGHGQNKRCQSFFALNIDTLNNNGFNIYTDHSSSMIWRSKETSIAFKTFLGKVIAAVVEVNNATTDSGIKLVLYTHKYQEIEDSLREVESCIGRDMKSIYDVESFLKSRFDPE